MGTLVVSKGSLLIALRQDACGTTSSQAYELMRPTKPTDPSAGEAPFALMADRIFDGHRWHQHAAVMIDRGVVRGIAWIADIPDEWSRRAVQPGAMLAPGFIDLQVNGGGGVLLNDEPTPDAMRAIAKAHRRFGTTACLPTLITDTREKAKAAIAAAKVAAGHDGILGLHLEGPFISPARPGIHPPERIASAGLSDLNWLCEAESCGSSLVTLAPECVPSGFIGAIARAGIHVSAGHTEASAAVMNRAVEDGLSGITHLHNAMPSMRAREPGVVGVALSDPRVFASLIVDGIHVDTIVVRATFAAMGADHVALITDAMPTVGTTADEFQMFDRTIKLGNGRLTSDSGTLAGAHLDMASAVRIAVQSAAVPIDDALRSASLTPARFLGISDQRGTLSAGSRADIVALGPAFEVLETWIGGVSSET
jgi:N-acetylglucosamine-6-phosphate deacetylase